MKYYKNIGDALKVLHPTDKVVKILCNKYAIVEAQFTNGTYDKQSIFFLHNNKVFFLSYVDSLDSALKYYDDMKPIERTMRWFRDKHKGNYAIAVNADNRPIKKIYRKLKTKHYAKLNQNQN